MQALVILCFFCDQQIDEQVIPFEPCFDCVQSRLVLRQCTSQIATCWASSINSSNTDLNRGPCASYRVILLDWGCILTAILQQIIHSYFFEFFQIIYIPFTKNKFLWDFFSEVNLGYIWKEKKFSSTYPLNVELQRITSAYNIKWLEKVTIITFNFVSLWNLSTDAAAWETTVQ